jgi:ribosome-binding protein aMBF1 (putative translation factor)
MSVKALIARSIQKADKSYFFEDYTKQAAAVMAGLKKEGWAITKKEADMDVFKKVADEMTTGRMKPEEHVKDVYERVLAILKEE